MTCTRKTLFKLPVISGTKGKERKGNVLFNDALSTFYVRLYGVRHMVKDHSDSERGNQLLSHGLFFSIDSKGSFICTRQDSTYHSLCYTSCGALAATRNSSMGPHHGGSIWRPIAPWANALTTELHLAPWYEREDRKKYMDGWMDEWMNEWKRFLNNGKQTRMDGWMNKGEKNTWFTTFQHEI